MRVMVEMLEYTFYTGANGAWTMHCFDTSRPHGEQYLYTSYDVSNLNPFTSCVTYDAWR